MLSGQLTKIDGGQCLLWDLVNTKDGKSLGGSERKEMISLKSRIG